MRVRCPVDEIDHDPVRVEIYERVSKEILGIPADLVTADGPLALVRRRLALEPSTNGGKRIVKVTVSRIPHGIR